MYSYGQITTKPGMSRISPEDVTSDRNLPIKLTRELSRREDGISPNASPGARELRVPSVNLGTTKFTEKESRQVQSISRELPMLPVTSRNDDMVERINVPWYTQEPIVRIASIGDGSCFIHSVLKAMNPQYQEMRYPQRIRMAKRLRYELAVNLGASTDEPVTPEVIAARENIKYFELSPEISESSFQFPIIDNDYENMIIYEITSNGVFPSFEENKITEPSDDYYVNYSLPGIQNLLNSSTDLGDEIYGYVSETLNVGIIIVRMFTDQLKVHSDTLNLGGPDGFGRIVIIGGNSVHYEVIGRKTDEGYQTVFLPDDPFVTELMFRKEITGVQ